jgi:hypothetical protein
MFSWKFFDPNSPWPKNRHHESSRTDISFARIHSFSPVTPGSSPPSRESFSSPARRLSKAQRRVTGHEVEHPTFRPG